MLCFMLLLKQLISYSQSDVRHFRFPRAQSAVTASAPTSPAPPTPARPASSAVSSSPTPTQSPTSRLSTEDCSVLGFRTLTCRTSSLFSRVTSRASRVTSRVSRVTSLIGLNTGNSSTRACGSIQRRLAQVHLLCSDVLSFVVLYELRDTDMSSASNSQAFNATCDWVLHANKKRVAIRCLFACGESGIMHLMCLIAV